MSACYSSQNTSINSWFCNTRAVCLRFSVAKKCPVLTDNIFNNRLFDGNPHTWDYPTMSTSTADAKRRIVLPGASPGDVYDVQRINEDQVVLVKLQRPPLPKQTQKQDVLRAISKSPLHPTKSWEKLKNLTREL